MRIFGIFLTLVHHGCSSLRWRRHHRVPNHVFRTSSVPWRQDVSGLQNEEVACQLWKRRIVKKWNPMYKLYIKFVRPLKSGAIQLKRDPYWTPPPQTHTRIILFEYVFSTTQRHYLFFKECRKKVFLKPYLALSKLKNH